MAEIREVIRRRLELRTSSVGKSGKSIANIIQTGIHVLNETDSKSRYYRIPYYAFRESLKAKFRELLSDLKNKIIRAEYLVKSKDTNNKYALSRKRKLEELLQQEKADLAKLRQDMNAAEVKAIETENIRKMCKGITKIPSSSKSTDVLERLNKELTEKSAQRSIAVKRLNDRKRQCKLLLSTINSLNVDVS